MYQLLRDCHLSTDVVAITMIVKMFPTKPGMRKEKMMIDDMMTDKSENGIT